ncbi:MAG: EAL domain-containing protein [Mariniblastus sp.]
MILNNSQSNIASPTQGVPLVGPTAGGILQQSSPTPVALASNSKGWILVVDDEVITRRLLAHQLETAGYKVDTAENGHDALTFVSNTKPDLVLMDISMPVIDGNTSLRMMRQLHDSADLPIIMMTSSSAEDQIVSCFDAGASDYLSKPIQYAGMIARIDAQFKLIHTLSALRESEQRYALASQGTRDGIWDWNLVTGEIYLSPRWMTMVGVKDPNWVAHGTSWLELVFHEDRERVRADLESHLCGESSHFETEMRMPDQTGGFRWMLCRGLAVRDETDVPTRIAGSLTDITEGKVADALTRLPNRTLFHDRVGRCVEQFKRNASKLFAVLYIDVNDFKLVNDSLGHDIGDEFLIQISDRLESSLRQSDSVLARLGGDEFGILIEGIDRLGDAMEVAERIQKRIKAPFSVHGREILGRISIGVASVSTMNASVDKIIREADTAMYYAKQFSETGISAFENRMQQESAAKLEIASELKDAILRDEMSLCYQPIIDAGTMQTAGFEALLRWNHPVHGKISPADFIPIAESNGMIVEIGNWVLKQACHQAVIWKEKSKRDILVSVNVSIRQFSGQDFIGHVRSALSESGVSPNQLKLEVTESLLMQKPEEMIDLLGQLQAMDVTTCIDDFGTGYSSLAYLHQMPLKVLKIDRSFIANLAESKKHQTIVRSIIALARSLELKVVAEGIETPEQAAYLQNLDCQYFQGFLFSHPVKADETYKMLDFDWSFEE